MPFRFRVLVYGALVSCVVASSGVAFAQEGFGDEFEDDFGNELEQEPEQPSASEAQPQPPEPEPSAPAGGASFGSEFEASAEAEAGTEQGAQASAAAQGAAGADPAREPTPPTSRPRQEPDEEEALREQRFRQHNTWTGITGGFHVPDAGSAAVGSFRTQLAFEFFVKNDYLIQGDDNDYIGTSLSMSATITDFLEIYGSLQSHANSNTRESPELFQVLGDTILGAKGFYAVLPWLTVGGDLRLALLNTVGDIGLVFSGTSVGLRGNATADLRQLEDAIPLIGRFSLDYYFDNSSNLIDGVEARRFANLDDAAEDPVFESRHLLSPVERFALGINRVDELTLALGVEAPLQAAEDFFIHPILEWRLGIPINRQGFECLFIPESMGSEEPAAGEDGCLEKQGFSAFHDTLTLGVRVLPPVRGLAAFAGVDIGLTGTSTFVRELAPTRPYNVMFGVAYAYDTRPPEPVVREVERRVEVPAELPTRGHIAGQVVEKGSGAPVAHAVISYPERELTAQRAAADGRFQSYPLEPGEVKLSLEHPEYELATCGAKIPEKGGEVELRCEMVALPKLGSVEGHVVDERGTPVSGADVKLSGPASRTLQTGSAGEFEASELPPGQYSARIEHEQFLIKLAQFPVESREKATPTVTVIHKPKRPSVKVARGQILLRNKIHFGTGNAEIEERSEPLLAEIADVLLRNDDIQKVEIQGHTDDRGGREYNMELSQKRAEAVRDWLVGAGVDPQRVEAKGYGFSDPLVPNITARNRARNRRVQFVIQERAGEGQ